MKKMIVLLCSVLMSTGSFSQDKTEPTDMMGVLSQLKAEQRIGDYYAVAFMAYAKDPKNIDLLDATADGLRILGVLPRALKVTKQVLARDPQRDVALKRKAELETELKRIQTRREQLEAELAVKPDKIESLVSLTAIHIGLKNLEEAREVLNRALSVNPNHVLVQLMKGAFEERLDRTTKQAILLSKDAVERYASGRADESLSMIQRALAMSVVSPYVYDNYATILMQEKDMAGARAVLREEMHIRPKPKQMLEIANLSLALGEFNQALQDYGSVIKRFGDDPVAYYNMSLCLNRVGDQEGARTYREKALELKPDLENEDRSALRIRGSVVSLGGEQN